MGRTNPDKKTKKQKCNLQLAAASIICCAMNESEIAASVLILWILSLCLPFVIALPIFTALTVATPVPVHTRTHTHTVGGFLTCV